MDMQDKEFDELFHSKLDNLEVNPSEQVWTNISGELNSRKRKISLVPLLSIAASVIVLVTAGVIFIPKKIKTDNGPKVKTQVASVTKPAKKNSDPVSTILPVKAQTSQPVTNQQIAASIIPVSRHTNTAAHGNVDNKHSAPVAEQLQPAAVNTDHNQLAAVSEKQEGATSAIVPDNATPIAVKLPDAVSSAITDNPKLAEQSPAADKPETAPAKRKRIRSLGDLINVVVAKVDKRKDKIIEFTDNDDDDESNITGVNLGVIKVKK